MKMFAQKEKKKSPKQKNKEKKASCYQECIASKKKKRNLRLEEGVFCNMKKMEYNNGNQEDDR